MPVEIQCPSCGTQTRVNERMMGREVNCPHCETRFVVPTAEDIAAAEQARVAEVARAKAAAERAAAAAAAAARALDAPSAVRPSPTAPREEEEIEPVVLAKGPREEPEMDMTPMVDVTFLLLIFFMLTASFQLQKSFGVPPDKSDMASTNAQPVDQENPDVVTVQVDEFNSFTVLTSDSEVEVPGKQNLIRELSRAKSGDGSSNAPTKLIVQAHVDAKTQAVIDAMDAGAATQFAEIELQSVEEFD
jgi:biopolymer transport protein ExbD